MARGVGGKSPANVAHFLSGIDFPCRKEDLIAHAERNGADQEVLEVLRNLPEGEYTSMADVMKAYSQAVDAEGDSADGGGSRSGHTQAGQQNQQRR